MNDSYDIALHIGLPKTATTTLQKNVLFPAHKSEKINFLGRSGELFESDYFNPFESILAQLNEEHLDDAKVLLLRAELVQLLRSDMLNVISEESLVLTHDFHYIRLQNLQKVLNVFNVRVLLSLREPKDFLYSYYIELYPTLFVRSESLNTLDKFAVGLINNPSNKDFDIICFDKLLLNVTRLFPKLQIILFEDLKHNKELYMHDLSDFFDLDQNYVCNNFFAAEQNLGSRSQYGKYSRKVSLLEKLQVVKGLFGETRFYRFKKYQAIYQAYRKVISLLKKVSMSVAVEHEPISEGQLKKLEPYLSIKRKWERKIQVDEEKLKLYGYMGNGRAPSKSVAVSLCLITYNHEKYIEDALNAALSQTFDDMEVVISDDCSIDQTATLIKENLDVEPFVTVKLNLQKANLGINAHVNAISKQASGQLIVIASGDDVSLPNRVDLIVDKWKAGALGVFSNAEIISGEGKRMGLFVGQGYQAMETWKDMVALGGHGAWGSTFAWDKKVSDVFGDIPENILGEDAVIPFRCALLGRVDYIDEPLVQYRDHGENASFWSQRKQATRKSLRDLGEEIIQFDLVMYQNWRKDIQTASLAGYLTQEDVNWAEDTLSLNEGIHKKQLQVLGAPLSKAVLLVMNTLWEKDTKQHRMLWFKSTLSVLLQFRASVLFKLFCFLRGK